MSGPTVEEFWGFRTVRWTEDALRRRLFVLSFNNFLTFSERLITKNNRQINRWWKQWVSLKHCSTSANMRGDSMCYQSGSAVFLQNHLQLFCISYSWRENSALLVSSFSKYETEWSHYRIGWNVHWWRFVWPDIPVWAAARSVYVRGTAVMAPNMSLSYG